MLISQNFGNEVFVLVGNSERKPVAINETIATVYVNKITIPTISHLLRTQTKVVTTTNRYALRSVSVPITVVGDNFPIKKLTQYLNLAGPVVSELIVTDDTSVNTEYAPQTVQNYVNDLTANVFATPSNTDVPISYYNATGTFWSTG
jgi:hypothetical protein